MLTRIIATLFHVFAFNLAFAQVTPIGPSDVLTYTSAREVRVTRENGQDKYTTDRGYRFFDPATHTLSVIFPKSASIDRLAVKRTQVKGSGSEPGAVWKASYSTPPSVDARTCTQNIDFDATLTAGPEETVTVKDRGVDTTIKVFTVSVEGWWSAPSCGNARFTGSVKYAPELGALYEIASPAGKGTLVDIRRGP